MSQTEPLSRRNMRVPAEGGTIRRSGKGADYRVDENGCWIWLRSKDPHGYGRLGAVNFDQRAHREYYKRAYGEIPAGWHVHHKCRVPSCVNPEHLEATPRTAHLIEHKLHEKTGLTLDDVKAIRERGKIAGVRAAEVAAEYGIDEITVYEYWSANHWADLLDGHIGRPVRTCLNCGSEFSDRQRHAKYCSASCRSRFNARRNYRIARGLDPDAPVDLRRAA